MTLQTSSPVPFIEQYERFLAVEESESARLVAFYAQAHAELDDFLLHPPVPLTASEQAFYGALNDEVKRLSDGALEQSRAWSQIIPKSFVEGALQHSPGLAFTAIHDNAARALSGYSLEKITAMSLDMRRVVQQQIGVGLLTGATRQQVSERILKSGLTNIPHWRSVEERAEAIARTEIMRSYNAGNLAGIRATDAPGMTWITGRDERVCPACGPRDGVSYKFDIIGAGGERFVGLNLPRLDAVPPLHVKCRCTVRAFYPPRQQVVTPTPRPDGLIEGAEAVPVVNGAEGARLAQVLDTTTPSRLKAAERKLLTDSPFDDDALQAIANGSNKAHRGYFQSRFGIELNDYEKFGNADIFSADDFYHIVKAFERYRDVVPRYVLNTAAKGTVSHLRTISYLRTEAGNMEGALASCGHGELSLYANRMLDVKSFGLRTAADPIEEIVAHEIGHAIHDKFGIFNIADLRSIVSGGKADYGALPNIADWKLAMESVVEGGVERQAAFWQEWIDIRAASTRYEQRAGSGAAYAANRETLAAYRADLGNFEKELEAALKDLAESTEGVTAAQREGEFRSLFRMMDERITTAETNIAKSKANIATLEEQVDDLAAAVAREADNLIDYFPTSYAQQNPYEDFAEACMLYLLEPAHLRALSPRRYDWIRKHIFEGKGGL